MRWIVASLVAVNILVFIYFQLFSNVAPSSVSSSREAAALVNSGSPSVVLLSEQSRNQSVASVRVKPKEKQLVPPVQPLCTLVGSFKRLLKAEYFAERLVALGLVAEIKNLVVASEPGYWLHLPPEVSRKEALRRLSELQGRGIDSYVIPSGNLANGISLGMFSKQDRAQAMQERIKKQGYKPQITNVPREQKEIWVFLPQGEAAKLSAERWAELLSSEDYLQKRQNLCADVASA
ncbi:MAG: SPOR domain-containing protein [Cellvibrionaceae bacterium]